MASEEIKNIQPLELKQLMESGSDFLLLDVRETWEHSLAAIPGSDNIPIAELVDRMQELVFEESIVVYCHIGERSLRAASILKEERFKNVYNLLGGIDAWSQVVDSSIPRYRPQV